MTDREREMLDVARWQGWHTLESPAEWAAARGLARLGYGHISPGGYGHAGSFVPLGSRVAAKS